MPPFLAMVVLLGQIFDDLEHAGQIKAPELGLVFNQLNALTGAEGAIGGIDGYGEATDSDAEALKEEGIEVNRIPWLPRTNS